ncbi:hypothetical protein H8356DRAFT_1333444 [Neocallimastix lanati (nom. inval.)]|nr:hypothetical protein H8356DRAFT_1333444 [Neocallimastix sp. JGI-2020a]
MQKRYGKESNEGLIRLRKRLEALLPYNTFQFNSIQFYKTEKEKQKLHNHHNHNNHNHNNKTLSGLKGRTITKTKN